MNNISINNNKFRSILVALIQHDPIAETDFDLFKSSSDYIECLTLPCLVEVWGRNPWLSPIGHSHSNVTILLEVYIYNFHWEATHLIF